MKSIHLRKLKKEEPIFNNDETVVVLKFILRKIIIYIDEIKICKWGQFLYEKCGGR